MNEFKQLGLSQETIDILEKKGFTQPTEIQKKTIPMLLSGTKNIIGKSQTGSGKTACFALPILEQFKPCKSVSALVLTPTRELAVQVKNEIDSLKGNKKISTLTVYGGAPINKQIEKLKAGVDIVVGTPGRIIDMIKRRALKLQYVTYVVLDEADEMLNMGFIDDIEEILQSTKKDRQMLLFSATIPKGILQIAKRFMENYEIITIKNENVTPGLTEQIYYDIMANDRIECLRRVIDVTDDFYGIIFCNTKVRVDQVANKLMRMNYQVAALHGNILQNQREQILGQFRTRKINILVATDVAARGIDVDDLTHVINYSLPQSPELYVHRIGRTGRAGKKGVAVTFVMPSEKRGLKYIENIVKQNLVKGQIPSIKEIFEIKKKNGMNIIQNIIKKSNGAKKFSKIADVLIEKYDTKEIILALLQYGFKNQFTEYNYQEIQKVTHEKSRSSNRPKSRFRKRSSNDHNYRQKRRWEHKPKNQKNQKDKLRRSDNNDRSKKRFHKRNSRSRRTV